jgi:DNA-binding transcriptional LysR family regulator
LRINELRTFVAVAETGSVQRAAKRLHMTQPAATRQVQRLEQALGTSLFDRRSKPLGLTAAGRRLLKHCAAILREVAILEAGLAAGGEPRGEFHLGVGHGVGELALSEPIDALRRLFPRVSLTVGSDWSRALLRGVEAGETDAAVVLLPEEHQPPARLVGRLLGREELLVIAPTDWPIAARTNFRALADHPWILNPEGCCYRASLRAAFDAESLAPSIAIETFGAELQLSLVARRVGLGLMTARKLARSAYRDAVKVAQIDDRTFSVATWSVRAEATGPWGAVIDALDEALLVSWT